MESATVEVESFDQDRYILVKVSAGNAEGRVGNDLQLPLGRRPLRIFLPINIIKVRIYDTKNKSNLQNLSKSQ